MQAKGLAPKALLSSIVCIKLHRNQGDTGQRPCVEDAFGSIKRNNLRMHRLMNQPSYFIISDGEHPMNEYLANLPIPSTDSKRKLKFPFFRIFSYPWPNLNLILSYFFLALKIFTHGVNSFERV